MSEMPKDVVEAVYPGPTPVPPAILAIPVISAIPVVMELRRPPRRPPELGAAVLVAQGGKDGEAQLKSERVEERLRVMPEWGLTLEDKAITRMKEFPNSQVAMLYVSYVTSLAGASNLPLSVNVTGGQVFVTLFARRNRGRFTNLTEAVLDLAEKIG